MVVCSNRKIAYALLLKFKDKFPEWFEEKQVPEGTDITDEELKKLKPMPFIAMVSSVGKMMSRTCITILVELRMINVLKS